VAGCEPAACGDGFVFAGFEECDDGNLNATDACTHLCKKATCGDAVTHAGVESCDDGNGDNHDMCLNNCKLPACGDGVIQDGEACDDGGLPGPCSGACALMASPSCKNQQLDPGEECDPTHPYFMKYPALCSQQCALKGCLRAVNTAEENAGLAGNQWLNQCAGTPGQRVFIGLVDGAGSLVFAAEGKRPDEWQWSPANLTAGQIEKANEWIVGQHEYLVPMKSVVPDESFSGVLMATSQLAYASGMPACNKALGDGYGLAVFSDSNNPQLPRLLVMGARGGQSKLPRPIEGFTAAAEIAFAGEQTMDVCPSGNIHAQPFLGTFVLAILPM
jgi:cysteine-rich repeat protein